MTDPRCTCRYRLDLCPVHAELRKDIEAIVAPHADDLHKIAEVAQECTEMGLAVLTDEGVQKLPGSIADQLHLAGYALGVIVDQVQALIVGPDACGVAAEPKEHGDG